jgi:hypothetical protein
MKKFLIAMIMVLVTNGARADTQTDHAIIGTILGGFIGYQIAKATAPQPQIVHQQDNRPVYDHRRNVYVDRYQPQPQSRCWTRLDRINSYGQPIYMQECHVN